MSHSSQNLGDARWPGQAISIIGITFDKSPKHSLSSVLCRARPRDGNPGLWKSLLVVYETDGNHVDDGLKRKPKVSLPSIFSKYSGILHDIMEETQNIRLVVTLEATAGIGDPSTTPLSTPGLSFNILRKVSHNLLKWQLQGWLPRLYSTGELYISTHHTFPALLRDKCWRIRCLGWDCRQHPTRPRWLLQYRYPPMSIPTPVLSSRVLPALSSRWLKWPLFLHLPASVISLLTHCSA